MARISVAAAKDKARNLQKWVCEKVSNLIHLPWGYEDDRLIQPRLMGQKGTDIVLRGEALKHFPFSVECKSGEHWSVPATVKQAKKNRLKNTDWLLVLKNKEMKKPIVVLDAELFFDILEGGKCD